MDQHLLVYGLCVVGLVVAAPLLGNPESLAGRLIRRLLGRQLARLAAWLLEQVRPVPHVDPAAEEWFRLIRREQLRVDLRRLQLLLVTDMHMSATRQLGNRLAYDSVLADINALGQALPASATPTADSWRATDWNAPVQPAHSTSTWGSDSQRGSTVETLDISWRS